jgi:hypothetical protein
MADVSFKSGRFSYPLGVKLANLLLSNYKYKQLNVQEQLDKAIKITGLSDYGDLFFLPAMAEVFKDINKHTNFHPLGSFLYHQKVQINLTNRLWAQHWLKKDTGITAEIPPAIMITGLQRTGTTFLQRLLGHLPEFRGVVSWEIINPVPKSEQKNYYGKYQAKLGHKALNYINPEFKRIHSIDYDKLEEEVVLMEHSFMSSFIEAAMVTPDYALWLEQQSQIPAYKDLKMWLQFLLWRKPAKDYLLLKSPHHMEFMPDFFTVFPNTKVIHLHRDPIKTMASFCSMIYYGKKILVPEVDPIEIGRHWLRKNKRLVDNCITYKKENSDSFLDIAYRDLVNDPILIAKDIYRQLNMTWTSDHEQRALAFCEVHRKNKFGKHEYRLSDYGLTETMIRDNFAEYYELYDDYLR